MTDARDRFGVCQWFHYEGQAAVERAVELLRELGVRHLRTGVSWADFHRPGGKAWYDYQMQALSEFEVLLSVWHTPPSLAEGGVCAGPPRRLHDYADFIEQVIAEYGGSFADLELWNEPNNRYKWDFASYDPMWEKFGAMVAEAARRARRRGKRTVLGGMIPVDASWLGLMARYGALEHLDAVAIHAFPDMWWDGPICWEWASHWEGWEQKLAVLRPVAGERPIWVTETGLATWDLERARPAHEPLQAQKLEEALATSAERVYWYSLVDLAPEREAIEGFHVDENEYHMGLVTADGRKKEAWFVLQERLAGERGARRRRGA